MHILMIAPQPFFRPRGTPFSVLHRIRALTRLGHSVDLVTYPFGETPEIRGLTVHRTKRPVGVHDVKIGPSLAKILLDVPLFVESNRLLRKGEYDLLHTHEEAGVFGAWVSRRVGIPHLYDMHSSLPQQFSNFGRFNWPPVVATFERMEQYTLNGADGVIAICPDLRDHVVASGYSGPLALIENTLDFDVPPVAEAQIRSLRQKLGLEGAPIVMYTGTLEAYQGLHLLIRAAPEFLEHVPEARLVIVGGTDDQIRSLKEDAQLAGVGSAFLFVPAVPPKEVFTYLKLADALVTTRSNGTNTPLKIYQYLRAGKPIVATNIHSHTQVLTETCAELVSPDPSRIAAGLTRVIRDRERGRSLAVEAARLAQEEYSEATYMERLEDFLSQLPSSSTGG